MVKISMIAIAGSLLVMQIRKLKPDYGQLLLMALGLYLFYAAAGRLMILVDLFKRLSDKILIRETYVGILLRMTGIAYVCEFAADLCRDADCNTIASQVEMIGKLSILMVSIPVITALTETITGLL